MSETLSIIGFLFLILITSYFVAAEFSFVKIRASRIEQLVIEGNKKALKVQKIINNLESYLSATQLGITIASLGLGWLGEPTVEKIFRPPLENLRMPENVSYTISIIVSFIIVTFFDVVIGELTPKIIANQKTESISLKFASSIALFYEIMYPFIWLLNRSANLIAKAMGIHKTSEGQDKHSEEEIKLIVSSSDDINLDEKTMVEKIFEFDETIAREIMVHRKDMSCIYLNQSLENDLEFVKNSKYSRFPVVGRDKDDIKGYVTIRDLYSLVNEEKGINNIIRQIPKVYESTPIKKVLSRLQKEKSQIAVVLDEYGGVSGLVSMEDVVEEIFGDIQDEFDNDLPPIRKGKNSWTIEGDTHIEEVENAINYTFEEKGDLVTIGGYILSKLDPDQMIVGTKIKIENKEIEILNIEDNRILLLAISK